MTKKILAVFAASLLLAGCATNQKPTTTSSESYNNLQSVKAEVKLAEAATSVSHSLQQLAMVERAIHPKAKLPPPPNPARISMAELASINWTGPVGPLVKKIAAASHYKVHVLGTPPAIPAIVSISAKNTPLADILRDAGFQAQKKAKIVVYPSRKIIELRYYRS